MTINEKATRRSAARSVLDGDHRSSEVWRRTRDSCPQPGRGWRACFHIRLHSRITPTPTFLEGRSVSSTSRVPSRELFGDAHLAEEGLHPRSMASSADDAIRIAR